jgi:hypothetical protein
MRLGIAPVGSQIGGNTIAFKISTFAAVKNR